MQSAITSRICICLTTLSLFSPTKSLEPLTTFTAVGAGLGAVGFYSMWDKIKCQTSECCGSPYWVLNNVTKFEESFDKHVFGQHIVKAMVSKQLRAHLRKDSPKKALVLSFHGWTGSGKNYVAKYIAESLFRKGQRSEFVKIYISTVDFPDESKVDIYKVFEKNAEVFVLIMAYLLFLFYLFIIDGASRKNYGSCEKMPTSNVHI